MFKAGISHTFCANGDNPYNCCVESVKHPVILASKSPRRQELLEQLGIDCRVVDAQVNESPRPNESPRELALRLSRAKAQAISVRDAGGEVVLAADTIVALDERILGKPRDEEDARRMLRSLRDRAHRVITAIAILGPSGPPSVQGVETSVWMRDYSDQEIGAFIASGEALDKAGAYAIQSQSFQPVARTEGCYLNVVGLPLCHVHRALLAMGIAPGRHPMDICPRALRDGCPLAQGTIETGLEYTAQAQIVEET